MSSTKPPKDDQTRIQPQDTTRVQMQEKTRVQSNTPVDDKTRVQPKKKVESPNTGGDEVTRISRANPQQTTRYQSPVTSPTDNEEITHYVRNKPPSATDFATKVKIGSVLKNRFELVSLIGKGGMGLVFKAKDLRQEEAGDLDPYVALKVLSPQLQNKKKFLIAMQQETKKTQKLTHPNIVKVYDFDRDGSVAFMTMELLQGTPLDTLIKEHRLIGGFKDKKEIIRALIDGINHAHEIGIVHADLKPNNIFIELDGSVKIFDFGIAQALEKDGQKKVANRHFDVSELEAVTPRYASIRALEGHPITPQDDYYPLGCVIYMILTGEHPYGRKDALQVRKEGLRPKPIDDLTSEQWEALRALIDVNRPAKADLTEIQHAFFPETRIGHRFNKIVLGVSVLLAVVLLYLSVGWIKHYSVLSELKAQLDIGAGQSLDPLFHELDNLQPEYYSSALQDIKPQLIALVEARIKEQGDYQSENFDLKEAMADLKKMQFYYPDSARISALFTPLKTSEEEAQRFLKRAIQSQLESRQFLKDGDWNLVNSVIAYQKTNAIDAHQSYQQVLDGYVSFIQERMFFKDMATAQKALSLANELDVNGKRLSDLAKQLRSNDAMSTAQQQEFKAVTYQLNQQRLSDFDTKNGSIVEARSNIKNSKLIESERVIHFLNQLEKNNDVEYQALKQHLLAWLKGRASEGQASKESNYYLSFAREHFPEAYPKPKKSSQKQDPCRASYAGKGRSPSSQCRDAFSVRMKGPTLVVIKGNSKLKTFAMTQQEISNLEFRQFCLATKKCSFTPVQNSLPVIGITPTLARDYANWISSKSGMIYRIPTWDEWRMVAKQSERGINDHNCLIQQGGKVIRGGEARSVDSGYLNSLGVRNMLGNASEYVVREGKVLAAGGNFATSMADCSVDHAQEITGLDFSQMGLRLVRELKN